MQSTESPLSFGLQCFQRIPGRACAAGAQGFWYDNTQDAGPDGPRLHDVCAVSGRRQHHLPPIVGLAAGEHLWSAAVGFLLTGVGLPLVTVVALARVGGGLQTMTSPIGKVAGLLLGAAIYLTIGPLFATPRTATVSFEMGWRPSWATAPWRWGPSPCCTLA
jgi:hypothetical protein